MSTEEKPLTNQAVFAYRVMWSMVGPVMLLGILAWTYHAKRWVAYSDAAYLLLLSVMIRTRLAEHRSGVGTTLHGEPSTATDVKKYAIGLLIFAIGSWLAVKAFSLR